MAEKRTPRRRRSKRNTDSIPTSLSQLPWQQLRFPYKPTEVATDEQLDLIHDGSMRILEEIGIDVLLPQAREMMVAAGAEANGERVCFGREMIMELLASVPSSFTLYARNPEHNIVVGDNYVSFGTVASAPNTNSLDGGRRPGNHEDYRTFLKLTQCLNIIHFISGYPVEPVDLHPSVRHLHCLADCVTMTDKVFHCYSLGQQRNIDAIEIARIGRGINNEQLDNEPSIFTIINSNSPLKLDDYMLQGIIEMASRLSLIHI